MEVKKNPEVAVERNSKLYFAIGLCLTLLFSWQMLEYKSYKVKVKPIEIISFEDSFEEEIPIKSIKTPATSAPQIAIKAGAIKVADNIADVNETFIESNIHEFQKPDKSYVVGNFITDPRLFVFLRQQFDSNVSSSKIEKTLADSLILFSLEGTASEKGIFKSSTVIKGDVAKFVKFNPRALNLTIDTQLIKLSTKPRQINHHRKADVYCLPYPTRLKLRAVSYTHLTLPTIYSV